MCKNMHMDALDKIGISVYNRAIEHLFDFETEGIKMTDTERQALIESIIDDIIYLTHPADDLASTEDTK